MGLGLGDCWRKVVGREEVVGIWEIRMVVGWVERVVVVDGGEREVKR